VRLRVDRLARINPESERHAATASGSGDDGKDAALPESLAWSGMRAILNALRRAFQ